MTILPDHSVKPCILIVDDDPDIGIALGDWLHQEDFSVHIVENGQAGINALKRYPYQIVILDLGLPDMDGLDVLKRMKEWDPHLPVIILTAFSFFERPTITISQHGAFAYLKKPYNRQEIKSTIVRALQPSTPLPEDFQAFSRPAFP